MSSPVDSTSAALPSPLRLEIVSDPATLADVRKQVERFAELAGLSTEAVDDVGLVINEALANVIRHAYDNATDRPIVVSVEATGEGIRLSIRDWGNRVNPASLPKKQHDPLSPGGLGLICLREMMTTADFTPQPDGMLLTMTKKK